MKWVLRLFAAAVPIALYRWLGALWLSPRLRVLNRWADSAAYVPVLIPVALACALLFFLGIFVFFRELVLTSSTTMLDAVLLLVAGAPAIAMPLLILQLLASRGRTADASVSHEGSIADVVGRCRNMLERHGFQVSWAKEHGLRALRGRHAEAESDWSGFPLEIVIAAHETNASTVVSTRCTLLGTVPREAAAMVARTAHAVANLDESALEVIDSTVLVRQGHWALGGLARKIFGAVAGSVILSVLVVGAVYFAAVVRQVEVVRNWLVVDLFAQKTNQLMRELDRPILAELHRLAAELEKEYAGEPDRERVLGILLSRVATGERLVGVRGRISVGDSWLRGENRRLPEVGRTEVEAGQSAMPIKWIHPLEGQLLRPELAGVTLGTDRFQRVGTRILRTLAPADTLAITNRLGLKDTVLVIGTLMTMEDIASLAPRYGFQELEMVFYESGSSFLRLRWHTEGASALVDAGNVTIPRDVILQRMRSRDLSEHERILLMGLNTHDLHLREERHDDGQRYFVHYWLRESGRSGAGWSGFAVGSQSLRWDIVIGVFTITYEIILATLTVIPATLLIAYLISILLAQRITRPVLEIRDALRSIADGNYGVEVQATRNDEIGQLQRLLNRTAVELRKRESIKELMGKYLSKQVADRIIASDSASELSGVRKEVSILFADVRGFTAYSERHDPEQVTRSLNEYFEIMVDVVAAHEGVLDKFIGDGLMVVFGAPVAQPDHARRAVITALEMQAALQSLNLKRVQRGDDPIEIGIGINTGLAISGNLGSLKRMEFTVIGDTVNTAARLESNARQGQILIGRATYDRVKEEAVCEALGPLSVKGKTEVVEIWLLKGLKLRKVF